VLGECHIELQEAVLTSHVTTIDARATLGSVKIFVPEGVEVRMSGKAILGSKDSYVTEGALPGAPVVQVRARAILGNVSVFPAQTSIAGHIRRALTGAS
jgi:predicted membrane protein